MVEAPERVDGEADRSYAAQRIIRSNILWSMGAGLIPVVGLDMAAISAVQLKMVRDLARLYDVPFRADIGKAVIASLAGGTVPLAAGLGVMAAVQGAARSVPVAGAILGLATVSSFATVTTYAVGTVFYQHFASGGTFLTFDSMKVKAFFRDKVAEARGKGPKGMDPAGQAAG